ncbi:MAG: hypothetical protein H0W39_01110 [Sphingomonas sp.]|nr:hypothetical protein [Sphingomonas sp.]
MQTRAKLSLLADVQLPTVPRTIVNGLAAAYPRSVSAEALIENIYRGVRDGGPVHARAALSVQVHILRQKLGAYGWTIPKGATGRGNKAEYRLCPVSDLDQPKPKHKLIKAG